jgi:16S rRNA processing protein RimM
VNLIDVGYARRAHGIDGEVFVRSLSDDAERWITGAAVVTNESTPRTLEVTSVRPHQDDLLVRFRSIDDRNAADALRGVRFQIPASERRTLDDGEYWPDDLVGCTVVDPGGAELGTVAAVEVSAPQDRLVVKTDDGARVEVPLVSAIVTGIDLQAELITVDPPDGLF